MHGDFPPFISTNQPLNGFDGIRVIIVSDTDTCNLLRARFLNRPKISNFHGSMMILTRILEEAVFLNVFVVYLVSSAVVPTPTQRALSDLVLCPEGRYLFDIEEGSITAENGGDQGIDLDRICRPCTVCVDGAKVLSPCTPLTDTVCGECVEGYIFDLGTKSCQPMSAIEGTPTSPATPPSEEKDDECKNVFMQVSATSIDVLFIASATLFAVVLTVSVILVIAALVAKLKYRKKKSTNTQGKNLPSTIPAFGGADKSTKKAGTDKTGHVNDGYQDDETKLSLILAKEGDSATLVTGKGQGERKHFI